MPYYVPCNNHIVCNGFVFLGDPLGLCEECKRSARLLDRDFKQSLKVERMQSIPKNEPRHKKGRRR